MKIQKLRWKNYSIIFNKQNLSHMWKKSWRHFCEKMYDKIYPKIRIAMSQEITSNFLILKKKLLYISSGAQHHSALPLWWGAHWFNGRSSVLQLRLTSVRIWPVSLGSYFPTHHVTAPLVFKIFVLDGPS